MVKLCRAHIYYLVRKYTYSTVLAYKAVGKLLEIVKVCSVTNNDVLIAFQKKAKDFEDCLYAVFDIGDFLLILYFHKFSIIISYSDTEDQTEKWEPP